VDLCYHAAQAEQHVFLLSTELRHEVTRTTFLDSAFRNERISLGDDLGKAAWGEWPAEGLEMQERCNGN
jgi:hypothetical protein